MLPDNTTTTLLCPEYLESHEERLSESIRHIVDQNSWPKLRDQVTGDKTFEHFMRLYVNENISDYKLLGGFFFQVAAGYFPDSQMENQLLNISYEYYGEFQKTKIVNNDLRYFIQWQKGVLEDALGVDWIQVEKTLADASEFYPARGEAFNHIIQHYRITKQEGIAYIFSSIAKDEFYGKLPAESRWFTNHSLYNWKVLYYHAAICRKLRDREEEASALKQLKDCLEKHPEYFTDEDRKRFVNID